MFSKTVLSSSIKIDWLIELNDYWIRKNLDYHKLEDNYNIPPPHFLDSLKP